MYPRIHLDHRSVLVTMECNQHDIGAIRHVVFSEDLTGKAVKYVIKMNETRTVTDWCVVGDDHHTVSMVIPAQITANPGSYDAQFIVLAQSDIDSDFEKWKAQVLAGTTPVMIESTEDAAADQPTSESAQSANLSFAFKILVFESVYANGNYFEGDLNSLIKKIQADNERITQENVSMKTRLTTVEGTAASHTTQLTNLSTAVGQNRLHCDTEIERVEGMIEDTDVGALASRVTAVEGTANATDTWKTQVLAGTTPVMIETEEAAADANESETNEAEATAQEEEVTDNGQGGSE